MAIDANRLAGYISSEIVAEFDLGQSNEQLDKYASAISRALAKFLQDDVEVKVGIQVEGQGRATIPGMPPTEIVTTVTGQTTTTGDLF